MIVSLRDTMLFPHYSPLSTFEGQYFELSSQLDATLPSSQREDLHPSPSHKVMTVSRNVFYLGLGAIVSIVINMVLLYIRVSMDFYPLHSQTTAVSLHDLKCPSQYIGLDRVIRTTNDSALRNKPLRRTNYPDVLVQISARNSGRGYLHVINRTSNFIISNEVSTIVQFRAADYGLTQCSIGFVVPPLIDLINTTKIYNSTGDPRGFQVDVWAVTFDGEFDHHTISAGSHSSVSIPRGDKLSTFNIRTGSESRTPDFPCVSGVWYTFEFAVSLESSDYGEVTLRQDYALPTLGIYMQQREA